jgi:hypothetical protein
MRRGRMFTARAWVWLSIPLAALILAAVHAERHAPAGSFLSPWSYVP